MRSNCLTRRGLLAIAGAELAGATTIPHDSDMPTETDYTPEQSSALEYRVDDHRVEISPIRILDRVRWREEWARDPREVEWSTYESEGYLVLFNVTAYGGEIPICDDDLTFEQHLLPYDDARELRLLNEAIPDAGAFCHPTDVAPCIHPQEDFDTRRPTGVVVEVDRRATALEYGAEAGDGASVGLTVYLPKMEESAEVDLYE